MEYLILIGLLPALLMNHIVYLSRPHAGVNARIRTAVPMVLVLMIGALWLAGRVGADIEVNLASVMLWLQALVYAAISSAAMQAMYARER